jgi:hypothetical protein
VAVPNVTIEGGVWGKWEYDALKDALGLQMRADAVGRMASLWHWCLSEETDVAPTKVVDAHLGKGGAAAILECELGEAVDGGIRIRGAASRVEEWVRCLSGKRRGGKKRAESAEREGGRFSNDDDKPTSRAPAPHQDSPANDQQATSTHQLSVSVSLSGLPEETLSDQAWPDRRSERSAMAKSGWIRLNETRRRVSEELGLDVTPEQPSAVEDEIRLRLREARNAQVAASQLDHVLSVLEAEAFAQGTVKWMTKQAFEPDRWTRALGMTTADAAKPRLQVANPRQAEPVKRRVKL